MEKILSIGFNPQNKYDIFYDGITNFNIYIEKDKRGDIERIFIENIVVMETTKNIVKNKILKKNKIKPFNEKTCFPKLEKYEYCIDLKNFSYSESNFRQAELLNILIILLELHNLINENICEDEKITNILKFDSKCHEIFNKFLKKIKNKKYEKYLLLFEIISRKILGNKFDFSKEIDKLLDIKDFENFEGNNDLSDEKKMTLFKKALYISKNQKFEDIIYSVKKVFNFLDEKINIGKKNRIIVLREYFMQFLSIFYYYNFNYSLILK